MNIIQAIIQSYKLARKIHGAKQAIYLIGIYRKSYPNYIFGYYPEYSNKKGGKSPKSWRVLDCNSWRYNVGHFSEMTIPEQWFKGNDWLPYLNDEGNK